MMRRVLALDLATTTGWAVDPPGPARRDAKPINGALVLSWDDNDFGPGYERFACWLEDAITVHAPDVLAFEAPVPRGDKRGFNAGRILLGLAAITELVATRMHVMPYEAHIQTVRKHFVGNGGADKADVGFRCRALGWDVRTNDAADACAVWDFARHVLRRPVAA